MAPNNRHVVPISRCQVQVSFSCDYWHAVFGSIWDLLIFPTVGRTARNKTLPSNWNASGWFGERNRRVVINHAEMMHCGLKKLERKGQIKYWHLVYSNCVSFHFGWHEMYIQWKWQVKALFYVLLHTTKCNKPPNQQRSVIWGCCRCSLRNLRGWRDFYSSPKGYSSLIVKNIG